MPRAPWTLLVTLLISCSAIIAIWTKAIPPSCFLTEARINPAVPILLVGLTTSIGLGVGLLLRHRGRLAKHWRPILLAGSSVLLLVSWLHPEAIFPFLLPHVTLAPLRPVIPQRLNAERDEAFLELDDLCGVHGRARVLLPRGWRTTTRRYPLILRVGHPWAADEKRRAILDFLYARLSEPCIVVRSGLIDELASRPDGKTLSVRDPQIWKTYAPAFPKLMSQIRKRYPVDESRIVLTGYSFDAVWAWMLGLSQPGSCSSIVALSAVSYPSVIQEALQGRVDRPTRVLRAQFDHMFPLRFWQETCTARRMCQLNPRSRWIIVPLRRHGGIEAYWPSALDSVLQLHGDERAPAGDSETP